MSDFAGVRTDRARWLVRLRWLALAFAAVAIAVASPVAGEAIGTPKTLGLAVILALVAAANALLDARIREGVNAERAMFFAVVTDAVLITVGLHMTGGVENPFQVYYLFPVIAAGIALPRRQSYFIAGLAAALFAALCFLEYAKAIPHHDVYLLPFWRSIGQQPLDQFEDGHYVAGTSLVLISTIVGASYLTTSVATQLRQNEGRLEGILRALGEGVAYFDEDDRLIQANESFRRHLEAPVGARIEEIAPESLRGQVEEAVLALRAGEPFESFEGQSGERWFACGLSAVRGTGGLAWVLDDITDRRAVAERATQEKRLADLGVLAAGIAHEVLNPLASISSTADIIESEPGDDVKPRVGKIRRQVDRITRIVRGVAELARPTGARPTPVALDEAIAEAVARAREERPNGAEVVLDIEQPAPRAVTSEEPLRVAVKNLVTNALDAAGAKGRVVVRARRAGDESIVEVEDDGPGVGDAEKIFVPFFTTKEPGAGAGLGLPIVASIVRQQGGKIEVSSTPGRGAKFTLRLPGRSR